MKYNVAEKFSPTPFGRYLSDGPRSAEKFRTVLIPLLKECTEKNDILIIDLDDIPIGIGSSFLEESFGGLVRQRAFTEKQLSNLLKIKSDDDPSYIEEIKEYIHEAEKLLKL
ncbi:DUF4325 domain-containing protein [Psychromonas sp. 14N.309.X.WAT.B.A12]|uniref:STAS-like domain-containing protein n=1 Tax=Psychromonas sp. 14N.309.X.WAT.B.A12 TaxID=2998322 RepID=UPI0025AF81A1|nr:DUF4325 domain-containing protein [Psychromonas sp. 14N.309.X.WAT.B.A12]MDN2661818.1 DUF4325 domain-containing protein [Psychromonas sp. 14N.309.X.WAT.B.A12]